jgi:uncharacterized iron-regulated membrane protein
MRTLLGTGAAITAAAVLAGTAHLLASLGGWWSVAVAAAWTAAIMAVILAPVLTWHRAARRRPRHSRVVRARLQVLADPGPLTDGQALPDTYLAVDGDLNRPELDDRPELDRPRPA